MRIKLREIGDFASLSVGSIIYDAECEEDLCLTSLPKLRCTNGKIDYVQLSLADSAGVFYTYSITPYDCNEFYLVVPDSVTCGKTRMISDTLTYFAGDYAV